MGRTVSSAPRCEPPVLDAADFFDPLIDDFQPKKRTYPHFDLPLTEAQRENFSLTGDDLARHAFWPLLAFEKKERRAKRREDGTIEFAEKKREIKFGSHRDAAILQWFGQSLSIQYEAALSRSKFSDSVLAYRSGVGSNIEQAKSLFDEIKHRKNCTCLAFDISGFFDHISHAELLRNWKIVRGVKRLSEPDFRVFERMTSFEWVEVDALRKALGRTDLVKGRICTAKEFRETVRRRGGLVQRNPKTLGIPQGSSISGLLANIAMLDFDRVMHSYLSKRGGSYRRYSDDIAILLPPDADEALVERHLVSRLRKIGLKINAKKTERSHFALDESELCDRPCQYLGFVFDGSRVLIRNSSLNRYYKKMARGIRGKVGVARRKGIALDRMFMRQLYKRYTHFGRTRNFPRYAYRAADVFASPDIRRQVASHMARFKGFLREATS